MVAATDDLIQRSVKLLTDVEKVEGYRQKGDLSLFHVNDIASRGATLIHSVTGPRSPYAENLRNAMKHKTAAGQFMAVAGVLQAFHLDLGNGHLVNIRHEVETIVVSEILAQARKLSRTNGVHPAAAVIVACAAIEEFLRNWCDEQKITVPEKQGSIARYAQELRKLDAIDLPTERRIQSWADYRNDAAHGSNWSKISSEIAGRLVSEVESFLITNQKVLV